MVAREMSDEGFVKRYREYNTVHSATSVLELVDDCGGGDDAVP